jgi:hypothetical protein
MSRKRSKKPEENKQKDFSLEDFFTIAACGFFGAAAVGFLFFQVEILSSDPIASQFIAIGLPGTVIFGSLKYIGVKQSALYAGVIFLIELVIAQNTMTMVIVRWLFLIVSMWSAMYIYKTMFIPRAVKLRELKAFGLGIILMVTNVGAVLLGSIVQFFISHAFVGELTANLLPNIKAGLLLGAGLGLGFELGERLIKKSRH